MITFWRGTEFKCTAAPCLEIHWKGTIYRLVILPKGERKHIIWCYKFKWKTL